MFKDTTVFQPLTWASSSSILFHQGGVCGQGELSSRRFLLIFDLTECLNPATLLSGCPTPQVGLSLVMVSLTSNSPGLCVRVSLRELLSIGSFEGWHGRKWSQRKDQTLLQVSSAIRVIFNCLSPFKTPLLQPLCLSRAIFSHSSEATGKGEHLSCMVSICWAHDENLS